MKNMDKYVRWAGLPGVVQAGMVRLLFCGTLAMMGLVSEASAYAYKITTVISMPKGSIGATLASTQPTNTKLTPCTASKIDAVTFTVTYDAGKLVADLKDVYFFLYHGDTKTFYSIKRSALGGAGTVITSYATAALLTAAAATDIYVKAADNLGQGSYTETLLGSSVLVDGVATGTWQLIGIIAANATVNFNDPTTWLAWDVATVMFSQPWVGTVPLATATCTP